MAPIAKSTRGKKYYYRDKKLLLSHLAMTIKNMDTGIFQCFLQIMKFLLL